MKKVALLDFDEDGLNDQAKIIFQTMWADNGDAISRQYAGTDAMKVRLSNDKRSDSSFNFLCDEPICHFNLTNCDHFYLSFDTLSLLFKRREKREVSTR